MSIIVFAMGLFFVIVFFIIVIVVVRLLTKKPNLSEQENVQNSSYEASQLQNESLAQQQFLMEEFKEVKSRLSSIEKILKEVE